MRGNAENTLVDLLGDTRAQVVEVLRDGPATVAELARRLELSEVAVRRHVQVLERDGFVDAETVRRDGPGRPSAQYTLTDRARRLFPDRTAELANELLDYLQEEHGRAALLGFLKWRQARQGRRYASAMEPGGAPVERVEQLAELLTEDGFLSSVNEATDPAGRTVLELRQEHCAIADVAEEHPELCAYEAALFKQLLGVSVSRRQTIAGGANACVCHIKAADPAGGQAPPPTRPTPPPRPGPAPRA